MEHLWFFGQTALRKQELQTGSKLRLAIEEARTPPAQRGREKRLVTQPGRCLSAVSTTARINWAQTLCREFSDFFELGPANTRSRPRWWSCSFDP
jgi:hypothetical protein